MSPCWTDAIRSVTPFLLWELFALWYYGFPFPNTPYAKLNTGVPLAAQLVQGLYYFAGSFGFDPVLLIGLLGSLLLVAVAHRPSSLALAAGIPLYLIYVLSIGGDFMAGPTVQDVDGFAFSDPLLARLPSLPDARVGHYPRNIPAGYLATLETGTNQIADANLALYYSKLRVLTTGNLWDMSRWIEIWKLNTGAYDNLLSAYLTDQSSP